MTRTKTQTPAERAQACSRDVSWWAVSELGDLCRDCHAPVRMHRDPEGTMTAIVDDLARAEAEVALETAQDETLARLAPRPVVKINTSDLEWVKRRAIVDGDEPVVYGTDITGAVYFQAWIKVDAIERTTFAGAKMIRFDLGADMPRDHSRWAMYPESYLVAEGSA